MVNDRHLESLQAAGNRLSDPPHADDPHGAVAQGRRAQRIGTSLPLAGAKEAVCLGKLPHCAQQKPERGVGDLFVEHVGRIVTVMPCSPAHRASTWS